MTAASPITSASKNATRKAKTSAKKAASKTSSNKQGGNTNNPINDSSRRIIFGLFIVLYICGALAFCVQVFVAPHKLSGLATVQQNNNVGAVIPSAQPSHGGSNSFKINPNTIQALHGLTDQQIRDKLGKEVKIQLKDKNGNTIQTTAKVDVQASTTEAVDNHDKKDVTINFDTYDGIATYHCSTANSNTVANDVILLNGGRYLHPDYFNQARREKISKGRYHEAVVLELCRNAKRMISSVTAIDAVSIQPDQLLSILRQLKHRNRIQRLPVAALITPGESSSTVIDWLSYGADIRTLRKQIAERWIPVSSESVLELDDGEIIDDEITDNASTTLRNSALQLIRGWPVLAIYGSGDILARQGAELLEREVDAKTIKLEGGADCLEQKPREFGKAVMTYLADQLKDSAHTSGSTNTNGMSFSLQFATS